MEMLRCEFSGTTGRIEEYFVDRIRKHWLNNGVVMHNPTSIYIGDEVIIKQDCQNRLS